MKPFIRYLWILTAFAVLVGSTYYIVTQEVTGTALLLALALMPLVAALWLSRHQEPLPSDDPTTTASDHAGDAVGSFPAVTVWPIFLVLGLVMVGAGLIYGLILIPPGLLAVGVAIYGLMQESRD